ncbi:MAG TPA: type II secretion system protein [Candidatus Acidoferrum sp.]|jgi:prepilin-type N-terminal cleavage/methylation domain-containing protein|nr:type II secretion system protein [Candidatus Acidoferrum sp.]
MPPILRRHRYLYVRQRGFSMVELLVVVTIILILVGSALVTMVPKVQSSRANAGMELVLGEMRRAHERAVDERRIYRVTFVPPNQIQLDIGQVANVASTITGTIPAFTQAQQTLTLPDGIRFTCVGGIPTGAGAVPDGLGSGANAIDFDLGNGGGGTQIYFQPDGRALDGANRLNDGVIYIALPGNLYSSRAVTLFGSTGRSKGWTLATLGGAPGWTQ